MKPTLAASMEFTGAAKTFADITRGLPKKDNENIVTDSPEFNDKEPEQVIEDLMRQNPRETQVEPKEIINKSENWKRVYQRRNRKHPLITGSAISSSGCPLKGQTKLIYLHLWRLTPETMEKEVIDKNVWLLVILVEIGGNVYEITGVYHSPNSSHRIFIDALYEILDGNASKGRRQILLGDFNINWLKKGTYTKSLEKCFKDNGLKQLINKSTRVSLHSETLIDLVASNVNDLEICILELPRITDHMLIQINMFKGKMKGRKCLSRPKNHDADLRGIEFVFRERDLSRKYEDFYSQVIDIIDKHMPKKVVSIRYNKDWFNHVIYEAIKDRYSKFKMYRASKEVEDWERYKEARNKVVQLVRQEKCKYYEQKIDLNSKDPKQMWKTLKQLVGGKKSEVYNDIYLKDECILDKRKLVHTFNDYFVNSIQDILNPIPKSEDIFNISYKSTKMYNFPSKASPDEIDVNFIKLHYDVIGELIINIVNTSLETGAIPSQWKIQIVKCDDIISAKQVNTHGVPQGSLLGPMLFILYINDIGNALSKCKFHLFADDTVIHYHGTNINSVVGILNEDLLILGEWFRAARIDCDSETANLTFLRKYIKSFRRHQQQVVVRAHPQALEQAERWEEVQYLLHCHYHLASLLPQLRTSSGRFPPRQRW
ncbi:hypothetical protein J437_LFUL005129 [Ladona fulva]|uniref:Reverse transcriptase domain-containing protein n=1 Tax=Ladona fulva TaxID=123851 RepID=A0A8K0KGS4_LADFU|nr:hypothetical protein J437_LFUL005129 [Ladona fulva]